MGNTIVAVSLPASRSFFARVWRAPFIGILLVLLYAHVNANVHLRNYNQSFLKPETWKYCVPGISTSGTYRLFQPPRRPSPPTYSVFELARQPEYEHTNTRAFCLTFTYRFSAPPPAREQLQHTYNFIITLSLIQSRFDRILFIRSIEPSLHLFLNF